LHNSDKELVELKSQADEETMEDEGTGPTKVNGLKTQNCNQMISFTSILREKNEWVKRVLLQSKG
jgi:hypothetical protein